MALARLNLSEGIWELFVRQMINGVKVRYWAYVNVVDIFLFLPFKLLNNSMRSVVIGEPSGATMEVI